MIRSSNTEPRLFTNFLYLAGVELILAGVITLASALSQNLQTASLLAVTVTVSGIVCLTAPIFLKNRTVLISAIVTVLSGRPGQLGALAIPISLSVFLFLRNPGVDAIQIIGVILACVWLIGIEALFFFQKVIRYRTNARSKPPSRQERQEKPLNLGDLGVLGGKKRKCTVEKKVKNTAGNESAISSRPAILSLALAYGILLIPSRVPSLLDGIPWNTPLEFIAAILLLPLTFFLGGNFPAKRRVTLLLALLFVSKLVLAFFLPQAGLGVRAYFSEAALDAGQWERAYESYLAPSFSQAAQLPYRSFREFPIEAINRHGFDKNNFWLALQLDGAISLREDERLVLLVQGTLERRVELVDVETRESIPVATAKSADDLDSQFFDEIPYTGKAELKGLLVFTSYGNARFEPVILKADGSVRSALTETWLSPSALDFPAGVFQLVQALISLVLLGIILFSLFDGISALYRAANLDSVDFYLALTGLTLYYIADISDKPGIHIFFIIAAFALAAVKMLDFTLRSRSYSGTGYLFSIGLPTLLMFLPLDIHQLQSVVILPQYQDALEYQMLARNIYVGGDAFLLQSPPWAYKVLFPYFIGLLHVLFGQSLSAQFFLNVWSAILSVVVMVELSTYFGLSKRASFIAASAFLLLLLLPVSFTYYFRFGLIEPVAILTLLLTAYFAKQGKFAAMFFIGVVTGMLRLNFAGAIFTAITFLAPASTGGFAQAWGPLLNWCRLNWKRLAVYLIAIPLPSLLIARVYSIFHPGYTLTHEMNDQTSVQSVLMSLASVVVGGDEEFLRNQIQENPLNLVLITLPILLGLLIALISLLYRKGVFARLDLRLSLFLLSMLPVYAVLKPIGYFPRYSWSFLPPALILTALVLQSLFLRDNTANQTAQENK